MNTFWIAFLISQALVAAEAFLATSSLNPALKAVLEKFIAAGQALANALESTGAKAMEAIKAVPFNPAQLATWPEAIAMVKRINESKQFQAVGLSILPQDPAHRHSGAYLPPWDPGPHGDPEPHIGDSYWIHYRFTNGMEGMNAGLVREKFKSFPQAPDYVLSQLLIEVQRGGKS